MSSSGVLNPPHTFYLGAYGVNDHSWVIEFRHADGSPRMMDGWVIGASVQVRNTSDVGNLFPLTVWVSNASTGQIVVHMPMNNADRIQGTSASGELLAYTETGARVALGTLVISAEEQP